MSDYVDQLYPDEALRNGAGAGPTQKTKFDRTANAKTMNGFVPPEPAYKFDATGQPQPKPAGAWNKAVDAGKGAWQAATDAVDSANRAGQAVRAGAGAATNAAVKAGQVAKNIGVGVASKSLNAMGPATHGAFYADENVGWGDKLHVAAGDALRIGGTVLGGAFGSGVMPVAGTIAGGYAGDQAGNWASEKIGANDVLRKHGYDPDRSVIDMGKDAIGFAQGNNSASAIFGGKPSGGSAMKPPTTNEGLGLVGGSDARRAVGDYDTTKVATPPSTKADFDKIVANKLAESEAKRPVVPNPTTPTNASAAASNVPEGYTVMQSGIFRKGNEFTNIGADGKPVIPSTRDLRTPDQIANGERIKAETAATVAQAGGLANLQRQNALMAANLRDGVDPYRGFNGPTVSVVGSGTRGNMRTDGPESSKSRAMEMIDLVKAAGGKVPHSTLRQIMQNETALQTNAVTNQTARLNNAETNATSRDNTRMTNDTAMYGHNISAANNKASIMAQMRRAQIDQFNKDREFGLQQSQEERAVRAEGDKRVEGMAKTYATGPDGKTVDPVKEAEYINGAHSLLGNAIAAAEKRGDSATAATLRKNGIGSLDPQDIQQHNARLRMKHLSEQSHGISPIGGTHKISSPEGYDIVGETPGLLWDTTHLANGGSLPSFRVRNAGGSMNPLSVQTSEFDSIRRLRENQ